MQGVTVPFSAPHQPLGLYRFSCKLNSKMAQTVRLGIVFDDGVEDISINGEVVDLRSQLAPYLKPIFTDWRDGLFVELPVRRGENQLMVQGVNLKGALVFKVHQSMTWPQYLAAFVFGVFPLILGIMKPMQAVLRACLSFPWKRRTQIAKFCSLRFEAMPLYIVFVGVALRLALFWGVPSSMYQHDFDSHVENIKFYAAHPWSLPFPHVGFESPQQPLYYVVSAAVYRLAQCLSAPPTVALDVVRAMSLLYSMVWLVLGLRLARLWLSTPLGISFCMVFLSCTPSFVFLGARINNDALNATLGMWALYEVSLFLLPQRSSSFLRAMLAITLAIGTKTSSVLLPLFLFAALARDYCERPEGRERTRHMLRALCVITSFVAGAVVLRAYLPFSSELRFMNGGIFPNQAIPRIDVGYFFSFNLTDLVRAGEARPFSNDAVRFSFPTTMFGTMLIGEYEYSRFFKAGNTFYLVTQLSILLALLYPIAIVHFFWSWRELTAAARLIVIPVAVNFGLQLYMICRYPSVCNSDFRYFTPSFGCVAIMIGFGLECLCRRNSRVRSVVVIGTTLLAICQGVWMLMLIQRT